MSAHPGFVHDEEVVISGDCGCRPGSWCNFHRHQAELDAGKAEQEREVARREKRKNAKR